MTFENQIWLTLTPLIVLLFAGLFAFGLRRRESLLRRFAAERLLDQLTEKASQQRTLLKAGLILLALALIGVALARPQYGVDWIERKARGLDIVFVLDSSKSMLATDLRPTRLDRAKLAIIDLVKRLESDRIGLVAFAGNAFLQTPPTLDYSAFRENLDSIGQTSISRGGSDIGRAIREAAKAFPKDNNFKVVILLTDGEDQEQQAIDTAREVAKEGIKIYTIGIGTPEGEYLKIRNAQGTEEFIRDSSGQPVRSQLDEQTLQEIAQLTGGIYSRLSDQSLNTLYNSVLATLPREERESELQEARIERYQWLISAACVLLILEIFIRRRSKASIQLTVIIATTALLLPTPSEAQELEAATQPTESTESLDLPLPSTQETPEAIIHEIETDPRVLYNQAHEQLAADEYAEATRLYEEAIERSEDVSLERDALYNMAHAINQIGEAALQAQDFEAAIESWKQAEALFKSANEIDPSDSNSLEDAASTEARRKALEEFLKQQEPEDQENQEEQDSEESEESEDGEEGEQDEQQEGEEGEDEGEQSEEESGEEGDESEQGEDGEQSDQEGDESESSDGSESEEPGEGENTESTGDPAEDMEQEAEEQAAGEGEEETGEEGSEPPKPTEGAASEDGEQAEMTLEGMSISEAQDLLDSLRGSEQLLPFSEPSDETRQSNRNREIRDW